MNGDAAEILITRARKARAKGNQKQEEKCIRKALRELPPDQKGKRANLLGLLASTLMTRTRSEQAMPFVEEALRLKGELGHIGDAETANLFGCFARIKSQLGAASEAEEYYQKSIAVQRSLNLPGLAETLAVLAVLLSKNDRQSEAMPLLEEARQLASSPGSKNAIEVFAEEMHRITGGEVARKGAIQSRLSKEVEKLLKQPAKKPAYSVSVRSSTSVKTEEVEA